MGLSSTLPRCNMMAVDAASNPPPSSEAWFGDIGLALAWAGNCPNTSLSGVAWKPFGGSFAICCSVRSLINSGEKSCAISILGLTRAQYNLRPKMPDYLRRYPLCHPLRYYPCHLHPCFLCLLHRMSRCPILPYQSHHQL